MAVIFQSKRKTNEVLKPSAVAYRPDSIQEIDKHHRQIVNKTCVISAVDDELQTIKTYLLNAAKKQGMSQETEVTALADGAKIAGQSYLSCNHIAKVECIWTGFILVRSFRM